MLQVACAAAMFTPMLPLRALTARCCPSIAVPCELPADRTSWQSVCDVVVRGDHCCRQCRRRVSWSSLQPARLLFCTLPIPDATFTPMLPVAPLQRLSPIDAVEVEVVDLRLPPTIASLDLRIAEHVADVHGRSDIVGLRVVDALADVDADVAVAPVVHRRRWWRSDITVGFSVLMCWVMLPVDIHGACAALSCALQPQAWSSRKPSSRTRSPIACRSSSTPSCGHTSLGPCL